MTTLAELQARLGEPKHFVAHVRRTIYLHGITQRALAKEAGVDYAQLCRWLRLKKGMSLTSMWKVDDALTRILYGAKDRAA